MMPTLSTSPLPKYCRPFPLHSGLGRDENLRRGDPRPYDEQTAYWLEYFHQLRQGPAALLRVSLDGMIEHEVKACYIRNGETERHARQRQVRKLIAMQRALVSLGGDELAPFLNDVLRQIMQMVTDATVMALRNE